ncbi:MAG TPA: 30S ribosomal protein S6 [Hyphomicrobiaceae bacterium]|jgi:small subunit ribosomal protein S6|nr:30S ribosomal protein S6 [Hyphomicrobiaceae bacterium]
MPLYEHVFLARQEVSPQQVETLTKEFGQVLAEGGGKVGKTEYWGLKSLAYKIKKSRRAHYTLMNIDAPPAAVAEMERRMRISSDIIRFLTVRVAAHETEPSVQMRKGERDERRGDGERGFRGDRGGFRGGIRGEREGGERGAGRGEARGEREGSTFRARSGAGLRAPREGGEREGMDGAPRPPRPPRTRPGNDTGSEG